MYIEPCYKKGYPHPRGSPDSLIATQAINGRIQQCDGERFVVHAEEKLTAFLDPAYSVGSPPGQTEEPTTNRGIWRKFETLM